MRLLSEPCAGDSAEVVGMPCAEGHLTCAGPKSLCAGVVAHVRMARFDMCVISVAFVREAVKGTAIFDLRKLWRGSREVSGGSPCELGNGRIG